MTDSTIAGERILVRLAVDTSERCVRAYERIAPIYDLLDAAYEWSWQRRLRARLLPGTRGRILDVGIGTGRKIPFYPQGTGVTSGATRQRCWC